MSSATDTTYDSEELKKELTEDEGEVLLPYLDTLKNITIGRGRNLSGVGISAVEREFLYNNDKDRAVAALNSEFPWWLSLPPPQQRVMINLCFNMGIEKLNKFHLFLAAMQRFDWEEASAQLKNSVWWTQVGLRGPRMVARLTGVVA